MPTSRRTRLGGWCLAATLLVVAPSSGCWESRCGKGQRQEGARCLVIADAAADGRGADGRGADRGRDIQRPLTDGAAEARPDRGSGLGDICTRQEECTGSASFCAVIPGTPSGYCTFKGCKVGGTDCPPPYFCMDLSAYLPGLTACVKI